MAASGPLRGQTGPHDDEGAGRERFWDMTEEQRKEALPAMVRNAGKGTEQDRRFARGWLSELQRSRTTETT
jgi:hypothetical protein